MHAPCADRRGTPPEAHRPNRVWRLEVPDDVLVATAEPAVAAVTPAAHGAVVEQRAGVAVAGADRGSGVAQLHRPDRAGRLIIADVVLVPVTQLHRS